MLSALKPLRVLSDGTGVKTNMIPRDTFPGDELTAQEKKEYDYLGEELDGSAFFRFKGQVYGLHEFVKTELDGPLHKGRWFGIASQSAFHAIVISFECIHEVVVGQVFS